MESDGSVKRQDHYLPIVQVERADIPAPGYVDVRCGTRSHIERGAHRY
ncbi:hypothetical protein CCP3SC1_70070 [Gammaproteobacteria bacterium]